MHIDLSLARGLDYYTGVIYEAVLVDGETKVRGALTFYADIQSQSARYRWAALLQAAGEFKSRSQQQFINFCPGMTTWLDSLPAGTSRPSVSPSARALPLKCCGAV